MKKNGFRTQLRDLHVNSLIEGARQNRRLTGSAEILAACAHLPGFVFARRYPNDLDEDVGLAVWFRQRPSRQKAALHQIASKRLSLLIPHSLLGAASSFSDRRANDSTSVRIRHRQ